MSDVQPPVPPPLPPPGERRRRSVDTTPVLKRNRKHLWILLAAIGFGVLVPIGFVVVPIVFTKSVPVTDADREALFTVDDLLPWFDLPGVEPGQGQFKKTRYFDGSIDLEYELDLAGRENGIYLSCTLHAESTESDAKSSYIGMKVGHKIGFDLASADTVTTEKRNDLFRWGDQSDFYLVRESGEIAGNILFVRKGTRLFALQIVGAGFEDGLVFRELVTPVLDRLESWE